jgi:hypothetical protein
VSTAPDGRRHSWRSLLNDLSVPEREELLARCSAPRVEDLIGWEYAGWNTNPLTPALGIRRFVKGFYEGPERVQRGPRSRIHGYNIACERIGDEDSPVCKPSNEAPKRYGFYRVHVPLDKDKDSLYPASLLLDYDLGGNGPLGPPLKDYIVQVHPDEPDLLFGKAYGAVGPLRVRVGYFVLERWRRHGFQG